MASDLTTSQKRLLRSGALGSRRLFLLSALLLTPGLACSTGENEKVKTKKETDKELQVAPSEQVAMSAPPQKLYRPEQSIKTVDLSAPNSGAKSQPSFAEASACPNEMVSIQGRYCIDRHEVSLVDASTQQTLSPFFPPLQKKVKKIFNDYYRRHGKEETDYGRSLAIPFPPEFSMRKPFKIAARSLENVTPAGYLSRYDAAAACKAADKRLCSVEEWQFACRGEGQNKFPYGESYRQGSCNVARAHHPASLLHADSSLHHLDPRLNRTRDSQGPLLRKTGQTEACQSQWQGDAAFDMVGNLDEWVASEGGEFLGGFYARSTREGCDAQITVHSPGYRDYSLGTRCCRDPQ